MTKLVWFRNDLRVNYHSPLRAACEAARNTATGAAGSTVRAVYVLCERQWDNHDVGPLRRWYVLSSLRELGESLAAKGIPLDVLDARGFAQVGDQLSHYVATHGVSTVFYSREYPINEVRRDQAVSERMTAMGVGMVGYDDGVLISPSALRTIGGTPYTVFTPFRRKWREAMNLQTPLAPSVQHFTEACGEPSVFDDALLEQPLARCDIADEVCQLWQTGERAARQQLQQFVAGALVGYQEQRDFPALEGTSLLSAALSAGTLSVRECYDRAVRYMTEYLTDDLGKGCTDLQSDLGDSEATSVSRERAVAGIDVWLSELCWRDFYRQIMANFPRVSMGAPFRKETGFIQWSSDDDAFAAWCEGRTGYPLVDAAMRQLRATGWMHNRLRMVVAMFLTKQLFIDWRRGERFFMQNLMDGDFAANNGGWQWSASTGTDAAPYFRFFNPVRQSQRFDEDGTFIRHWLPELAALDNKKIHEPWKAAEIAPDYWPRIVMLEGTKERVTQAFRMAKEIDQMGLVVAKFS